ncbi:MAG: SDR family oxidoreductase [Chloroflexota bacterium]
MGIVDGKVALVFGAGSGIGRATANAFAQSGTAAVVVAARSSEALLRVAAEVEARGSRALAIPLDVSIRDQVDSAVRRTIEAYGQIDVIVNTAGINTATRRMDELPQEEWSRVLNVNLNGAFNTTQAVLGHMRERKTGLIVQVSSVSGRYADLSGAAYQASKHGIIGLCQATMFEERANGIRVSAILPGLVDTPMPLRRPVPPPRSLLDQAMQPEDVAMACVFLASLPPRTYVPELILLPGQLQVMGQTAI